MENLSSKTVVMKRIDLLPGDASERFIVENSKRGHVFGTVYHVKNDLCRFIPNHNVVLDWRTIRDIIIIIKRIQQKLDKKHVILNRMELPIVTGAKTRKILVGINDKMTTRKAGLVKWHPPAMEYCYFPYNDFVLINKELQEIIYLIKELNKERKEKKENGR